MHRSIAGNSGERLAFIRALKERRIPSRRSSIVMSSAVETSLILSRSERFLDFAALRSE
jgi:hypothetical protein